MDIVHRAALADCLLVTEHPFYHVSDCGSDYPHIHWLHNTVYLSLCRRPHYLMIILPSCTIRVCRLTMPSLNRFQLYTVPDTIKPPSSLTRLLVRY